MYRPQAIRPLAVTVGQRAVITRSIPIPQLKPRASTPLEMIKYNSSHVLGVDLWANCHHGLPAPIPVSFCALFAALQTPG